MNIVHIHHIPCMYIIYIVDKCKSEKSPGLGLGRLVEGNPAKIVLLETNTQNKIDSITDCRVFNTISIYLYWISFLSASAGCGANQGGSSAQIVGESQGRCTGRQRRRCQWGGKFQDWELVDKVLGFLGLK